MEQRRPSPKLLAQWVLASALLAPSGWFAGFLPLPWLSQSARNRSLVLLLSAFFCMVTSWILERRFTGGFRQGKWSDEELATARSLLGGAWWKWLGFIEFAIYTWAVFFAPHGFTDGAFFYVFIYPLTAASRLIEAITPRVASTGGLRDWKNFKPIQSEHWGEPARHGDVDDLLPS